MQLKVNLETAAGVVAVGCAVAAVPVQYCFRLAVIAVSPQESLPAGIEAANRCTGETHPAVHSRIALTGGLCLGGKVILNGDAQQVIFNFFTLHDEHRILQVDLVLLGIPLVGKFTVGKHR